MCNFDTIISNLWEYTDFVIDILMFVRTTDIV